MTKSRVVFMGTPYFASTILEGLIRNEYDVVLVVSQPDREKKRHGVYLETPTKSLAKKNNIDVFQSPKIKKDYQKIIDYKPDIIITAAYGQIIPKELLDYPKYGCINVHGSILPALRGGAPIHHALMSGLEETGITIMYMSPKMDAGDIIEIEKLKIDINDNLETLTNKMAILGRDTLLQIIPKVLSGTNKRVVQNEQEVTFAYNITKEEEKLDFNNTSFKIYNHIRALSPNPGAYFIINNKRIKVFNSSVLSKKTSEETGIITDISKDGIIVSTLDGSIALTDIQLEGKKRGYVKDIVNGLNKKDYLDKKIS